MSMKNARFGITEPTAPTLAGLVWREAYSCYTTKVAGCVDLSFNYKDGGFHISVMGRRLKATAPDAPTAAAMAVRAAQALLAKATVELAAAAVPVSNA